MSDTPERGARSVSAASGEKVVGEWKGWEHWNHQHILITAPGRALAPRGGETAAQAAVNRRGEAASDER